MRVVIDKAACSGHGRCYTLAPSVFAADDNGYGELVIEGKLPPELEPAARTGEANCPERAIRVIA